MLQLEDAHHDLNSRLILTPAALEFLLELVRAFRPRLRELLEERQARQLRIDRGEPLDFLAATAEVRRSEWSVAPAPRPLHCRKVEITGPTDPKTVINALNSGADVFMADFEDATSPTWENLLEGQASLHQAVRRGLRFIDPRTGRDYQLAAKTAALMVRPRGLHLRENHVLVDGESVPACLFDFGLFAFHNAAELLFRGAGPYFYLPKLQSHLEARWWNDVFVHAQRALGIARGSMRATVLIETLPAAFEMDEILFELQDHSAGLNCGRWDYIFSTIKTRRAEPSFVLPDRAEVTMDQHFLRSYTQLLVRTCHRRGAFAIGGMSAFIPVKDNPAANEAALDKVRADKLREVQDGHDGTWVAHPGLVALAHQVFDAHMSGPNQLAVLRADVDVTAADLLAVPTGARTAAALRHNIRVALRYLAAWLDGRGCVPIDNLMEDAATAEICRAQVWQWLQRRATLASETPGEPASPLTAARFLAVLGEERAADRPRLDAAARLLQDLVLADECPEFLTLPAYQLLLLQKSAA